jgi:hypothetical protein
MSDLRFGGKITSLATPTGQLYRLASTMKSKWASPALFAVWGIRALPSLGQDSARTWTAGEYGFTMFMIFY